MTTVRYTTIDGEVIAEKRNGARRLYVPDPLGSTVALLDNTQAQTDTFTYWPYGEVRTRTGTTATPFQFLGTTGYYQNSTNRSYVRARVLEVQLGRWLTSDPVAAQGENPYLYARANPILYSDPEGAKPQSRSSQPKCNCSSVVSAAKQLIGMDCGLDDLNKGMACIDVWGTATLNAKCGFEKVPKHCPVCNLQGVSHLHSIQKVCEMLKKSGHWQNPCNMQQIQPGCLITFSVPNEPDQGCGAHSAVYTGNGMVIMCSRSCPGATTNQPKICERNISDWIGFQQTPAAIKGCGCFCKKGR
jgi:RHS repeat-associated protein